MNRAKQANVDAPAELCGRLTEALLRSLGATPEQLDRERERVHAELIGRPATAEVEESPQEQPAAGPESQAAVPREENEAEREAGPTKETCYEK